MSEVQNPPLRGPLRALRCAFAPLLLVFLCTGGDWPQFRGPDGLAVAHEAGLPVNLGADSAELAWKAPVRGEGISSPIVVDGRVVVTSAYPGQEHSRWQGLKSVSLPVLSLLVLALGLRELVRRRESSGAPLLVLDGLATAVVTAAFLGAALLAAFSFEVFPGWSAGVFGWAWFYTGGIALAGLAAALGWLRPRSPGRLIGAAVLLAAAFYLYRNIRLNTYGLPFEPLKRWVMVAPALGGALWHAAAFTLARASGGDGRGPRNVLAGAALVFMAAVLFVTVNFLQPRAGLVRAVLCYDLGSGELLWDTPLFVAPEEQKYDVNSFATPTPCSDGERIFAYFGAGWACLDLDGEILWEGRDESYAPNTRYGCGSSPVPFEDTFIILQEKEYVRPSFIVAFDRDTGAERWRVNPQYAGDSYNTPLLVPRGDTVQLVAASGERVVAHDPRSGELLWQFPLPIRQVVPSSVWRDDLLFIAGGTHSKTACSALRLAGEGSETTAELLWQSTRSTPQVASPVLAGGLYFTINDGGIVTCYEPETGETLWRERVAGGVYWASLVAGDGKLYTLSDEGVVTVLAAGPEFGVLGSGELGEGCMATPAIADGRVVVRTMDSLFCFGETLP